MRTLLIHNPNAGYGQVDAAGLMEMLSKSGHEVTYQSSAVDDLATPLAGGWELVVVAGGDGTVTRVTKLCVDRPTPLAILPLGSANNLAIAVGHFGPLEDLIKGWDVRATRAIDIGVVAGDWGRSRFAESFGVGLTAATMQMADRGGADKAKAKFANAAERLAAAMKTLRSCLRTLDPIMMTVETPEGVRQEKLLWAEVTTVKSVGPRLSLFESEDLADGKLSYALLPAEERDAFEQSLSDREEGHAPRRTGLITGRAERIVLAWGDGPAHLDGSLLPSHAPAPSAGHRAEVTVQPRAVRFLRVGSSA